MLSTKPGALEGQAAVDLVDALLGGQRALSASLAVGGGAGGTATAAHMSHFFSQNSIAVAQHAELRLGTVHRWLDGIGINIHGQAGGVGLVALLFERS